MKVFFSPVVEDKQQTIKFNGEVVEITVNGTVYLYDFSNFTDGRMISENRPIFSAERSNGELSLVIDNFIDEHATEEERFPSWKTIEGNDNLSDNPQVVEIEWITKEELDEIANAPKPPTEIEFLNKKIATQDQVIEEIMFIIIPEITGGGI